MDEEQPKKEDVKKKNDDKEIIEAKEPAVITEQQYDEIKDRMLRLAAEFDNYKKRSKAEIEQSKLIGKAEFLRNMLAVLDEFELAVVAANNSTDQNLSKGISLLYSNFRDFLKKEGLTEIDTEGIFDPYKHEIMMVKEDTSTPGTILSVMKKGYLFNGIMIRPASVIVAKQAQSKDEDYTNDKK